MNFYEFTQNNSGGSFVTDENLCHRLFIEAETHEIATEKAEEMGVYFDGCERGLDCPCCGDRWNNYFTEPIDLTGYTTTGIKATASDMEKWKERYSRFETIKPPKKGEYVIEGVIKIKNVEDYAQYLAFQYGHTIPDARIFYANGETKEIFK